MIRSFSVTDIGRKRQLNQDFVFTSELPLGCLPNLFVVADGMGGHKAGDFASKYTVETIIEEVGKARNKEPVEVLQAAIVRANQRVRRKATEDENMVGMGTTVVASTYKDGILYVANVGDSRLYIVNDEIRQITRDHSYVEEMVRMGNLDRVSARNHPDKNIITRAIGASDKVEIDFYEYRLKKGDIILMCTDGLSNMVEDEEMLHIVKCSRDVVEAVEQLIERAKDNGGNDNIGVIVAQPFADEVNV